MTRFLPLAGALLVVFLACCWRAWLQRRRYGTWGIVLFRSGRRDQDMRDSLLVIFFLVLVGQAGDAALFPDSVSSRFVARGEVLAWLQAIGAVLIYVALLTIVAGYAMLLPTWLSIGLAVGTFIGVHMQVRGEEAYLADVYGDTFRDYARRVGRFVPGLGRLR